MSHAAEPWQAVAMLDPEYRIMAEAERSHWWYGALHARILARVDRAGLEPGACLLDAGCGTGELLRKLRRHRPDMVLIGVDTDAFACRRAGAGGMHVVAADIQALPLATASLDGIVCADVFSHAFVGRRTGLPDLHRCLKPGGHLVMNVPAHAWMMSEHDRRVMNVRRFSKRQLVHLLEEAGFVVDDIRFWNSLLLPMMILRRHVAPQRTHELALPEPRLNRWLGRLLDIERRLASGAASFPFGGSLIACAHRGPTDAGGAST